MVSQGGERTAAGAQDHKETAGEGPQAGTVGASLHVSVGYGFQG